MSGNLIQDLENDFPGIEVDIKEGIIIVPNLGVENQVRMRLTERRASTIFTVKRREGVESSA